MGTSVYFKYPPGFDFGGQKVLNLGCGTAQYKHPNVVNMDAYGECDVIHNLEDMPLPFEDNTFDLIVANHVLEHLHDWWGCLNECARILKVGGVLEVHVPGGGSDGQLGYRDHVSVINNLSFFGTASLQRPGTNSWAEENRKEPASRLKTVRTSTSMINAWWIRIMPNRVKGAISRHLRNVNIEESFYFRKLSEEDARKFAGELKPIKGGAYV